MLKALIRWGLVAGVVVLLAIQLVPYGRRHTNPPVRQEPSWDSPRTRELVIRACYDCHSNQTGWLWYTNIAPASWLIQNDVDEGRRKLNYSEWDLHQKDARKAADKVEVGKMPPIYYAVFHRKAWLADGERAELIRGLAGTFGRRVLGSRGKYE
ncbi:MAG TPA: heme-binding domain-containing protein [Candidatus Methylomirabilis sp.]|nr:heme-binding domain-containing protein [Candidatus Methylomirabilis sp.]